MKRYIYNEGTTPMIVGGVFIPPGDGREVDEHLLPPEHQPPPLEAEAAPAASPDANLQELLAGSVASILPTLEGLGNETLNRLAELEAADKGRKTLQEAIAAQLLQRAAAAVDGDGEGEGEGEGEGQGTGADFQDTQPGA